MGCWSTLLWCKFHERRWYLRWELQFENCNVRIVIWELKCEIFNLNCNYPKLLIFWHLTVAVEYTGMILKSNCILCLFWNFIFYNKNEIWLTNLNREKRFIFLDIDKTRNNNINRNNWSDSAAASVQQCDTAYALREEKGTNGWRRALARQSEAKAVTFWRANGDQVVWATTLEE